MRDRTDFWKPAVQAPYAKLHHQRRLRWLNSLPRLTADQVSLQRQSLGYLKNPEQHGTSWVQDFTDEYLDELDVENAAER